MNNPQMYELAQEGGYPTPKLTSTIMINGTQQLD